MLPSLTRYKMRTEPTGSQELKSRRRGRNAPPSILVYRVSVHFYLDSLRLRLACFGIETLENAMTVVGTDSSRIRGVGQIEASIESTARAFGSADAVFLFIARVSRVPCNISTPLSVVMSRSLASTPARPRESSSDLPVPGHQSPEPNRCSCRPRHRQLRMAAGKTRGCLSWRPTKPQGL